MFKPLLPARIKTVVRKNNGDKDCHLIFNLRTLVNGKQKRGSFGFIEDPDTGTFIYVSAQYAPMPTPPIMYRYARNGQDYRGGVNHFCYTVDELSSAVGKMMKSDRTRIASELGLG